MLAHLNHEQNLSLALIKPSRVQVDMYVDRQHKYQARCFQRTGILNPKYTEVQFKNPK